MSFCDKRAFISGGTHGIGLATAKMLAAKGCHVAVCGRDQIKLSDTKREIEKLGVKCLAIQTDVLDRSQIEQCIDEVKQTWDGIDILVNNVGGGGRWGKEDILATNLNVWYEVFQKNVWSSLSFTLAFLHGMIERNFGRIVFVTSIYGVQIGGRPWFNMSKIAQTALMKNLATVKDFVRSNITFNAVAPGDLMIPGTGWDDLRFKHPDFESTLEKNPMGRFGTADEVAQAICYLSSTEANYINGCVLRIDGGSSVSL